MRKDYGSLQYSHAPHLTVAARSLLCIPDGELEGVWRE